MIETRDQAIAWLDSHIGRGTRPGLERMAALLAMLGDPQDAYEVIHVAGTNGKTTVSRVAASLLVAHGLRVGTTISPHLEAIEERLMLDLVPASPAAFVESVRDLAGFVELFEARTAFEPTYFELSTALALSHFAASAIDVAVVEVGMGGRLDATNVIDAEVAVVTSIARDHIEWLGDTLEAIAGEKLAIVKEGSVLVTGPLPTSVAPLARARTAEMGATHAEWGRDYAIREARIAVGGWSLDVSGVHGEYDDLYLPLHGRHQAVNAVVALAATEGLFGRALDPDAVVEGFATASSPGRIEVASRDPFVIIDGAHNPSGFEALTTTLLEEFGDRAWVVVLGAMGDKELAEMVKHLAGMTEEVFVTAVDHPRAIQPAELAAVIDDVLGIRATVVDDPHGALAAAIDRAGSAGSVLVAGSIYLVGELRRDLIAPGRGPSEPG